MSDEPDVTWASIGRENDRQAEINKADRGRYAIAEVTRLRAENWRLREALKPFSDLLEQTYQDAHEAAQVGGVVPMDEIAAPIGWYEQASAAIKGDA